MKKQLAVIALCLLPAAANAQVFADPAMIDAAVSRVAGAAAQPVDRRLRLAPCTGPLAVNWYAGRTDTVLVQCPDSGGWRLFVPVLAAARQPDAVVRGEAVTVAVSGQGFTVSQPGEALEGGPVGTWIRVRLANSATSSLRARIVRPGLVRVETD